MMTPKALRAYRQRLGISLRALSEEIGVRYTTLHRFEKGKIIMSHSLLKIIAWGYAKEIK